MYMDQVPYTYKPLQFQSVPYDTKSVVPYNTMNCLLPFAGKACHDDALPNHLLHCELDMSSL